MAALKYSKKYKHIIWDWNGTLLDDAWLCVEVLNFLLKKYNKPVTDLETYRNEFTFPVKDYYIDKLGFDFSDGSFDRIANEYIAEYNRRRFECTLHEGSIEILDFLKAKGVNHSILSAYYQKLLQEAVNHFKLADYFCNLAGLNDYYAKGKIYIARKHLEYLQEKPEKILLIGDTIHDYEVAKDIGADCVLLSCGHQAHDRLAQCGCEVLDSMSLLMEYLK